MNSLIVRSLCVAAVIGCLSPLCRAQSGNVVGEIRDSDTKSAIGSVRIKSRHIDTHRRNEPGASDAAGRFHLKNQYSGRTKLRFYRNIGGGLRYFRETEVDVAVPGPSNPEPNPFELKKRAVGANGPGVARPDVFYLRAIYVQNNAPAPANKNALCRSPAPNVLASLQTSDREPFPLGEVRVTLTNAETDAEIQDEWMRLDSLKAVVLTDRVKTEGDYNLTVLADGYEPVGYLVINQRSPAKNAPDGCLSIYTGDGEQAEYSDTSGFLLPLTRVTAARDVVESEGVQENDAALRRLFLPREMEALPVPGLRPFDYFALLTPGVAPAPETFSNTGPGVSPGVGTAGQFSVNGLRSRENNFTVDGSDNNDEDIGVRRQGFLSLAPQPVESLQEFQVVTALADARFGRNIGGQLNAITKTGATQLHGSVYSFYTGERLRAREFFDRSSEGAPPAHTVRRASGGAPVLLDGATLTAPNRTGGEDAFRRTQAGFALGGPVWRAKKKAGFLNISNVFFFTSLEQKVISGDKESHFIVPTVEQRGVFNTGATGLRLRVTSQPLDPIPLFPASIPGNAFFSLFPFPNDPGGPFGRNTYTEVLPADGKAVLLAGKLDFQFGSASNTPERPFWSIFRGGDILTGRYNFTQDKSTIPVTGGALYSSLVPRVRTQNIAFFLNRTLRPNVSDSIRFSFGRTRLEFAERRHPALADSALFPATEFLLNAPLLLNVTTPGAAQPAYVSAAGQAGTALLNTLGYAPRVTHTEQITGPLGQVYIPGFSPLGVDVYHFPQERANNTFQIADTITYVRENHVHFFGADIRKVQINSRLDRNFRPLAVFNGLRTVRPSSALNVTGPGGGGLPTNVFSGATLAAAGVPTGLFQNLAVVPDSNIGIRSTQVNLFAQDQWRIHPRFRLTFGVRYELNTVPDTVTGRLERAFDPEELRRQATEAAAECNAVDPNRCDDLVARLAAAFPADFKVSFGSDRNDFDFRFGAAWNLDGDGDWVARGGFGSYSGQQPAIVMSQSRAAFSDFLQLNFANFSPRSGGRTFLLNLANPLVRALDPALAVVAPGTLNTLPPINPISLITNRLVGLDDIDLPPTITGLNLVLPQSRLQTPYSLQYGGSLEFRFRKDYFASAAYVGTNGRRLLRVATPALGVNRSRLDEVRALTRVEELAPGVPFPFFQGRLFAPQGAVISRAFVIAPTFFDSDAGSSYHSLQLDVRRRYARGFQFSTSLTYSHAIDDASDFFDTAGAFALPQSSVVREERASSNYDVRFRSVTQFLIDTPAERLGNLLGNWQVAGVLIAQTGQPYTVNSAFDINRDGNLTDRLNTTAGLLNRPAGGNRHVQLSLSPGVSSFQLLAADEQNGAVGRNTFRAPGIFTFDLALSRALVSTERQKLLLRAEIFNFFNRTHFGIPVRILESPAFGRSQSIIVPPRTIQFALKYSF